MALAPYSDARPGMARGTGGREPADPASRSGTERYASDHQVTVMPFVTLNVSGGQKSADELR